MSLRVTFEYLSENFNSDTLWDKGKETKFIHIVCCKCLNKIYIWYYQSDQDWAKCYIYFHYTGYRVCYSKLWGITLLYQVT